MTSLCLPSNAHLMGSARLARGFHSYIGLREFDKHMARVGVGLTWTMGIVGSILSQVLIHIC